MLKKMKFSVFFLLISFFSLIVLNSNVFSSLESSSIVDKPLNGILYPRIGFPEFISMNETLLVELSSLVEAQWSATLVNEVSIHNMTFLSAQYNSIRNVTALHFTLESDINRGMYDLALLNKDLNLTHYEPHSVVIRDPILPLRILFLADPHINDDSNLRMKNTMKLISLVNFISPDLVIIAGDFRDSSIESYFIESYDFILELSVPILVVPGNHDHSHGNNHFLKYIAPSNRSLDIGSVHIVSLDSGPGSLAGWFYKDQIEWLEEDLKESQDSLLKILVFHHPLFTIENRTNANIPMISQIVEEYNVSLILNGHMHRTYPIIYYPTLTLIDSIAFPGGNPYSCFRIIDLLPNGTIDYRYADSDDPMELLEIGFVPYQVNDGSTYGGAVLSQNNLRIPMDGTLVFRVKQGCQLIIKNATLDNVTDIGSYLLVSVNVSLGINEKKLVLVYTEQDEDPPNILETNVDLVKSTVVDTVFVNSIVIDEVLGVKKVELRYSLDNESWEKLPLVILKARSAVFQNRLQLEKGAKKLYYYIEAWDVNELKSTSALMELQISDPDPDPDPAPESGLLSNWIIIVPVGAVILVIVLIFIRKKS